jgi:hypothetical protein
MSRIDHLKIKIASLSAEAALIHKAERKLGKKRKYLKTVLEADAKLPLGDRREPDLDDLDARRLSMYDHRKGKIAKASRYALLALAFFRGHPYATVEAHTRKKLDFDEIEDLVNRFDLNPGRDFAAWRQEAEIYIHEAYEKPWLVAAIRPYKPAPAPAAPAPKKRFLARLLG